MKFSGGNGTANPLYVVDDHLSAMGVVTKFMTYEIRRRTMEEKNKQLPELRPEDLPLQEIEGRTLMFPKILELAVKNTQASDWIDYGGNPWLDTPGAERIARVFGFTVKDTRFERLDRQDRDGPYYIYIWYGRVGLSKSDLWIDAIGACSSKKPFHSMEHGKRKHIEDINEMNILKDAYSNMTENGVTRFLGLRGLDWETLEKQGIQRSKVARVEFKSKQPEATEKPKTQPPPKRFTLPEPKPQEIKDLPPLTQAKTEENPFNKDRDRAVQFALTKALGNRAQIEEIIPRELSVHQLDYIVRSLSRLTKDIDLDTLQAIVRAAVYREGNV